MTGIFIGSMLVGLLIGSLLGGLILWALAKGVGKITTANFGNSFLVCLLSSLINLIIWWIIGTNILLSLGFTVLVILNIIFLSVAYITIGKLIWKCEWIQSVKANIIWIIAYAIVMAFTLSKISI